MRGLRLTRRPKYRKVSAVDELCLQIKAAGLPEPQREYRFHVRRRWRFDVAFTHSIRVPYMEFFTLRAVNVAVEVEGGVYVRGRHTRGAGVEKDCEKYAHAAIGGWTVLRVTPRHVQNGEALQWIQAALKQREQVQDDRTL